MNVSAETWTATRRIARNSVRTSLHCTITSINPDGSAHATPIGSVILTEPGRGYYFDIFNQQLSSNLDRDPRATILAVDSSKYLWSRSLLRGHFLRPPGVTLTTAIGPRRPATPEEVAHWRRLVDPLLRTPGGRLLWGFTSADVRDITVHDAVRINLGPMTDQSRRRRSDRDITARATTFSSRAQAGRSEQWRAPRWLLSAVLAAGRVRDSRRRRRSAPADALE